MLASRVRDFVWGSAEQRKKDPFASRAKSLWQSIEELDQYENAMQDGFSISPVYTACRIYGNAMATLDYATYREEGDQRIEAEGHPVTKLLTQTTSPHMTSSDWKITSMFHWGITGNAVSYIVRNRKGDPIELVLIDPHDIVKVYIKNGKKYWEFSSYKSPVPDSDIFHVAGPGWNGLTGKNPIEAHRGVMGTSLSMRKYLEKFFENGAHLKYVLEKEDVMGDEEYNNLLTSWHTLYSGPDNAGKTVILEDGVKIKPVSLSPVDSAYLELSGNITKTVANIYGLPLYLFNDFSEGAQYDNVESQDLALIKYAIAPMAIKWEEEIKRKLLPPKSKFCGKFDLFSLSKGDMKSISEYVNRYFIVGALNQDEIRKKFLNMNPLPDGQGSRYYVQGNNMVPIDKIDQIYDQKLQGEAVGGGQPEDSITDTDLPTIKED